MIEVPEVIEAAQKLDTVLGKPGPHERHSDWGSIASRLDEQMRERLVEFARKVI